MLNNVFLGGFVSGVVFGLGLFCANVLVQGLFHRALLS